MTQLEAIWLNRPVGRIRDNYYARTCRIQEDDLIKIQGNTIQYLAEDQKPTHKVLGCFGTIDSSVLEVMTIRLKDNKPQIINAQNEPKLY